MTRDRKGTKPCLIETQDYLVERKKVQGTAFIQIGLNKLAFCVKARQLDLYKSSSNKSEIHDHTIQSPKLKELRN